MEEIEEIRALAEHALEIAQNTCKREEELEEKVIKLEKRVDMLDGKMDTLLDSTSQIKMLLSENTSQTKSTKRNVKGFGFISIIISFVFRLLEFIF